MSVGNDGAVMVFSGKGLGTMITERGTGHWKLDKNKVTACPFVIVTRNLHADWSEPGVPHGTAWLVGRISGLIPADDSRWIITISEYAIVDRPRAWPGTRFPLTYTSLGEQGIDPRTLEWVPFPMPAEQPKAGGQEVDLPALVARMRSEVATRLGLPSAQIEISIRA